MLVYQRGVRPPASGGNISNVRESTIQGIKNLHLNSDDRVHLDHHLAIGFAFEKDTIKHKVFVNPTNTKPASYVYLILILFVPGR